MLPPKPWTVFEDGDVIAKSAQGVEPLFLRKLHVYGHVNGLYHGTPALVGGAIVPIYPDFGTDPLLNIIPKFKNYPLRAGARGEAIMTPYTTWHGHTRRKDDGTLSNNPRIPMWVGLTMNGWMTYAMRDGTVLLPYKVKAIEEGSYANDFTFFTPDRKKFYVAHTHKGRLIEVNRVTDDPATWVERVVCQISGLMTSCRAIGPTVFMVDQTGNRVLAIDPLTETTPRVVVSKIDSPFWIDYFSNGDLCVTTNVKATYRINPASGAVSTAKQLMPPQFVGDTRTWVTVDVDRHGTFGEVDSFVVIQVQGAGNIDLFRVRPGGQYQHSLRSNEGAATVGDIRYVSDSNGHYPWVAVHHPDEGLLAVQGFANLNLGIIAVASKGDSYDHGLLGVGRQVIAYGQATPSPNVPSFTALMAIQGGSLVGCSLDHIGDMSFDAAEAFIRAGMIGSVPRTLDKTAMRGVMYYAYRNSQRFLREGDPLIKALLARYV